MRPRSTAGRPRHQEGQILVLFALGLVAMIAMVGLVLDGGNTFAQRRDQQNGADLAAVAGANAYLNGSGSVANRTAAAVAAARAAATRNGYTQGTEGASVGVSVTLLSSGAQVKVDLTKPHANTFARVIGFNTWDVSVTATAQTGVVDTAVGAAPWIMHEDAFNGVTPIYDEDNPGAFGEPPGQNKDYPKSATDISWTDFNGSNNVNAAEVRGIIEGTNVVTATMQLDQYIGQHNNGMATTIFGEIDSHLKNKTVPVPIVGPCPNDPSNHGCFKGWALFHVTGAAGGSTKQIYGYFIPDFVRQPLSVGACTAAQQAAGSCGVIGQSEFGAYLVRLTD